MSSTSSIVCKKFVLQMEPQENVLKLHNCLENNVEKWNM